MLNGLDLFSGIGGISIALNEWVRTAAYCEIDPYCQGVLLSRMANGSIDKAPIWDDIRTLNASELPKGHIDIVYGGFPCQDISVAGRGKGLAGERSGLFFEIVRLAEEIRPKFLFIENVPAICARGGLRVVNEITQMGYDCRWCVISAASIGALHRRERWFLLAHANSKKCSRLSIGKEEEVAIFGSDSPDVADSLHKGCDKAREECDSIQPIEKGFENHSWEVEPSVGRVVDGIPRRVDRIRSLGNAVVARQAKEAFKTLMGIKYCKV